MTRLNVNDARCEALFASALQRSDAPTAEAVAEVISRTVRQLGIRGCASQMAQEFGDHPDMALDRMRWVRQLVGEVSASPAPRRPASHWERPARRLTALARSDAGHLPELGGPWTGGWLLRRSLNWGWRVGAADQSLVVEDHVALANRIGEGLRDAGFQPVPQTISKMDVCLRLVPNNEVVGHIDNDNWQAAQQVMAGQ